MMMMMMMAVAFSEDSSLAQVFNRVTLVDRPVEFESSTNLCFFKLHVWPFSCRSLRAQVDAQIQISTDLNICSQAYHLWSIQLAAPSSSAGSIQQLRVKNLLSLAWLEGKPKGNHEFSSPAGGFWIVVSH